MAAREPGRFRRNLFGGFNRKDVLSYIKTIFRELDQAQTEAEILRQRCIELENLIQNLEKPTAWAVPTPVEPLPIVEAAPIPAPVATPTPIPVAMPEPQPIAAPIAAPAPAPAFVPTPTFTPSPAQEWVPNPPYPAQNPEWIPNPLYDPELIAVLTSEPLPAEEPELEFILEPAPAPASPASRIKHSLTIPPSGGPTKVKVQRM